MAAPRIISRGRCALAKRMIPCIRSSVLPSFRTAFPQRQFASSSILRLATIETPSGGSEVPPTEARTTPPESIARSIALLRIPKRASRAEVEALIQSHGFDITRLHLKFDRFTFQNDTLCFVELGSEQQASEAIQKLTGVELLNKELAAKPLKQDFVWSNVSGYQPLVGRSRYFEDEGTGARDAVKPILEGRRYLLSVETPGWGAGNKSLRGGNETAMKVIEKYIGPYGIECVGALSPFYGDKKENPRLLTFLDFKTKEGATDAAKALHETEIEGRLTWLKVSELSPWRAYQIGKLDKTLLAELQEQGVAPQEVYQDKFTTPLPEKSARERQPRSRQAKV